MATCSDVLCCGKRHAEGRGQVAWVQLAIPNQCLPACPAGSILFISEGSKTDANGERHTTSARQSCSCQYKASAQDAAGQVHLPAGLMHMPCAAAAARTAPPNHPPAGKIGDKQEWCWLLSFGEDGKTARKHIQRAVNSQSSEQGGWTAAGWPAGGGCAQTGVGPLTCAPAASAAAPRSRLLVPTVSPFPHPQARTTPTAPAACTAEPSCSRQVACMSLGTGDLAQLSSSCLLFPAATLLNSAPCQPIHPQTNYTLVPTSAFPSGLGENPCTQA